MFQPLEYAIHLKPEENSSGNCSKRQIAQTAPPIYIYISEISDFHENGKMEMFWAPGSVRAGSNTLQRLSMVGSGFDPADVAVCIPGKRVRSLSEQSSRKAETIALLIMPRRDRPVMGKKQKAKNG
jgi:hypothetical protein